MTKILVGKIINTHGIKGELKLLSDFDKLDRLCKIDFPIYIDEQKYLIKNYRYHKNCLLITLDNYTNINEVLFLVGKNVYVERTDLDLKKDEYLLSDLIGASVYDNEVLLGTVSEIIISKMYPIIRITKGEKSFLVPLIEKYIKSFDEERKIIQTNEAKSFDIK